MEQLINILQDYGPWVLIGVVIIYLLLKSKIEIEFKKIVFIFPRPKNGSSN